MRKTILSFLEDCTRRGDETACSHRRGLRISRWSYARLAATAFQIARELELQRINKGDRVLLRAESSPEWVAAFFGCLLRGAIVVPLDEGSTSDFIGRVQQQVEAKLLLDGGHERDGFDARLPCLRIADLSQTISDHSTAPYPVDKIAEHDIVEIIYTSGTTAEPKGVILTHRNLLANLVPLEQEIQKYLRWERFVHPVRFLNLVPLSHIFGQFMGIFVPQLLGGRVFFQESLNPSEIIDTVKRERINVVVTVPRLLETLRDKVERDWAARGQMEDSRRALASADDQHFLRRWWTFRHVHLRFGWKFWAFISGGATLPAETERFWQRLGFAVLQGYGMTETASLISVNHPFKKSHASIGRTLPGQELRLDESGEIMVRGENVSQGYWGNSFQHPRNEDGWLRTGDIAEMDSSGNLYFKGRKKDVIVTGAGMNIYPEDIEAALDRQPEVRTSVVISAEGPGGPEPLAVLVLRHEGLNPEAAVRRANEMLAQHQQVRRWVVWQESDFPRTRTQKVRRHEVAAALRNQTHGDSLSQEQPSPISEAISRITGHASPTGLDPSANLTTDLKLDSLGRVELLSALEDHYQVDLNEAAFTAATNLGDLEKMVREGASDASFSYPFPEWTQRFPATWLRLALFYTFILPLTRLMCWVRVRGEDHLRELRGPVLFVSNHITMTDHALILSALPGRFRRSLAIAMEGEILRDWRLPPQGTGWHTRLRWLIQYFTVATLFNTFPLPRKSGFRRSFAFAGESMDRGYSVLLFPEGSRTEHGEMNPFKTGAGLIAAKLHAPVVPIRIDGLFELKRQRKYFARPGQVTINFGEPVSFDPAEDPASITRDLQRRVASL